MPVEDFKRLMRDKRIHSWNILFAGYTIEKGVAVLRDQNITFVTGAPRFNHTGAVILMATEHSSSSGGELQKQVMISGEQVGSYFGSAITLADLNNDG